MKYTTSVIIETFISECNSGNITVESFAKELTEYILENDVLISIPEETILRLFVGIDYLAIHIAYLSVETLKKLYPNKITKHETDYWELIQDMWQGYIEKLILLFELAYLYKIIPQNAFPVKRYVKEYYSWDDEYIPEAVEIMEKEALSHWLDILVFEDEESYRKALYKARGTSEPIHLNVENLRKEKDFLRVYYNWEHQKYILSEKHPECTISGKTPEELKLKYKDWKENGMTYNFSTGELKIGK